MSQHDFNIANQTFPSFRADLNDALQAAATISAGATAPSTSYAYQLWFDTSTNTYKARNAGNSAWISLFGNDLTNGGITFGDNDKAIFGASQDLQIYHDGSNSYISDQGTGNLLILSDANSGFLNAAATEWKVEATTDGAVKLYYDGNEKLATTATGVDVSSTDATVNFVSSRGTGATHTITTGGANSGNFNINAASGGDIYVNAENKIFRNAAGSTEHMRIDSSGNVLVGTTTAGKFKISGASGIANADIGHVNGTASGYGYVIFRYNDTIIGRIDQNGTTGVSYVTSSDYRLKTAVTYDWDATTRLKQLRPARFEWIADGDDAVPVDGFLAHEVQDIVPEAISGTKDAMRDEEYQVSAATGDIYTPAIEAVLDEDGNEVTPAVAEVIHSTDVERPEELAEGQQWRETTAAVMGTRSVPDHQGIDQSKLVPLLVKTIQELEARITALEAN
jgi:hypothetical protein